MSNAPDHAPDPGPPPDAADAPAEPPACANCGTVLVGRWCHGCGQSARNPMAHLGHAIEDVFESFWHLDGRIFRTVRDLPVPGRLPANYLAGRRARYVAPMRLFVILTLFAFFVGSLTVRVGMPVEVTVTSDGGAVDGGPGVAVPAAAAKPAPPAAPSMPPPPTDAGQAAPDTHPGLLGDLRRLDDQVRVPWLPGFANRWLAERAGKLRQNAEALQTSPRTALPHFVQTFLGGMPTALFLLMPVFALLLKLAWLGSGRGYLEHLVVALYSHCWLMVVMLASFILPGFEGPVGIVGTTLVAVLWLWTPIYLFASQVRIYGGALWINVLRYLMVGIVYASMVLMATMFTALFGLAS